MSPWDAGQCGGSAVVRFPRMSQWSTATTRRSPAHAIFPFMTMALMAAVLVRTASGHPAYFTTLQVTVGPAGQFQAVLNIDILAYALGKTSIDATNEELDGLLIKPRPLLGKQLADAGDRFRREVVVRTDVGDITPSSWNLPGLSEVEEVLARKIQPRILMPGEIDFTGTLPTKAHKLSIRLPYVLGDTMHVYELPNGDSAASPVAAGGYSESVHLNLRAFNQPTKNAGLPAEGSNGITRILLELLGCLLCLCALFIVNRWVFPFSRKT